LSRRLWATCRHFGIAPKTLYVWFKRFKDGNPTTLEDRSHRPHRVRQKISSWKIQQVIQRFRLYPNPKRAENTAKKRRRAWKKKRVTELQTEPHPGFLFCLDTVVRHFEGENRYILTGIDRYSRLSFARMYTSHSSQTAADFLRKLDLLLGGQITHIQTDNGSEFHKNFEAAIQDLAPPRGTRVQAPH